MREVKVKSTVPIYLLGAAWAGYAALFPLYRLQDFIAPAVLGGLLYFGGSKLIPPKIVMVEEKPLPVNTGDQEADQILNTGRGQIEALKKLHTQIKNQTLSQGVNELAQITKQIFDYLEKRPEKVRQARQFTNYYLPTTIKLLKNYQELELQPTRVDNISEAMKQIEETMDTVTGAFKKVLDDLFAGHTMDITVDAQILERVMEQEGLDGNQLKL